MTKEKIREVLNIYRKELSGISGQEFAHTEDLPLHFQKNAVLKYTLTMIDKIEEFLKEDRMEKAFRWLGFIQGCLWTSDMYTIGELKNHNRP